MSAAWAYLRERLRGLRRAPELRSFYRWQRENPTWLRDGFLEGMRQAAEDRVRVGERSAGWFCALLVALQTAVDDGVLDDYDLADLLALAGRTAFLEAELRRQRDERWML